MVTPTSFVVVVVVVGVSVLAVANALVSVPAGSGHGARNHVTSANRLFGTLTMYVRCRT